jgi:HlyD family secretion protein
MPQPSSAIAGSTIYSRMSRVAVVLVLLVTLALAGAHYLFGREAPGVKYRFEKVETGPLVTTVSASGTVRPVQSVAVTSQATGQVAEVLADFDSVVKAGQVLARLDPAVVKARLDQAQAS